MVAYPPVLYTEEKTRDNDTVNFIAAIENDETFHDFVKKLKQTKLQATPAHIRLNWLLLTIYKETVASPMKVPNIRAGSKDQRVIFENHSSHYFKMISKLFSSDYDASTLKKSGTYRKLYTNASRVVTEDVQEKNALRDTIKNTSSNWLENSNHLNFMYTTTLDDAQSHYEQISDDASTLERQAMLSKDQIIRVRFYNTILIATMIYACVFILINYISLLLFSSTRAPVLITVMLVYILHMYVKWYTFSQRHVLMFQDTPYSSDVVHLSKNTNKNKKLCGQPPTDETNDESYNDACK